MFPRTSRRSAAVTAGLAMVTLLVAACSSGGGSGPSGSGSSGSASTLIAYTGQASDYQVNFNPYSPTTIGGPGTIYEPLFFYNQVKVSDPVPLLGTEQKWNDAGTELTVTTRDKVKWTDGQPFTAKDVAFTFDLITKNPTMNGGGYKGKAVALDDTHVKITFPQPAFMDGPQLLGKTFILPEHLWKDVKDPSTFTAPKPIGTGPYTLAEFGPQAFTLGANPGYWGGPPAVKKVRYLALSGNQAGADAIAAGKIDWQTGPVPDIANVERNYRGYQAITVPLNQMALFTCSNAALGCTGPQTDVAVRKAIYYAMDRTQLNALAFQNTASEISPGLALRPRDQQYTSAKLTEAVAPMTPDTAKAEQLLTAAGYAKGGDGIYAKGGIRLSFDVLVPTGWNDYITALNTLGQQVKKAGIEIKAQLVSWNEWSGNRGNGKYQMLIDSLNGGPAADPYYLYTYFFNSENTAPVGKTAQPNFARFKDPAVDAALAALKKLDMTDTAARQPYLDTIQQRIGDQIPYIPLLTGGTTSVYHDAKFTGWPTKDDLYAFPAVWSQPDAVIILTHLKPAGR